MHRIKDEALELQRRDLTNTFESIMKQREDSIIAKENEISKQIQILDTRFEKLQTENMKLRSQYQEIKLHNEKLSEENIRYEESHRQISYKIEEVSKSKLASEDILQRQVNSLQMKIQDLTNQQYKERSDYESKIEKVRMIYFCYLFSIFYRFSFFLCIDGE